MPVFRISTAYTFVRQAPVCLTGIVGRTLEKSVLGRVFDAEAWKCTDRTHVTGDKRMGSVCL